jgi:hypothetical protein
MAAVDKSRVDVGALAAAVKNEAMSRVASMITCVIRACDERGFALNDKQISEIIETSMYMFDGFERECAKNLVGDLAVAGVPVWGLPSDLEDLAGNA